MAKEKNAMYKWNIDITLQGSGVVKRGVYSGPDNLSGDVIKKLFHGRSATDYVNMYGTDMNTIVYVCIGQIAAIDIYRKEG